MKEATGELNMTVVTLVAVAAIGAIFYLVIWPLIQGALVSQTCKTSFGSEYTAKRIGTEQGTGTGNSNAKVYTWQCCDAQGNNCKNTDGTSIQSGTTTGTTTGN